MSEPKPIEHQPLAKKILPPLPFTYVETNDQSKAQIQDFGYTFQVGDSPQRALTREEILKSVKQKKENENWFTTEYWREKGEPQEQIDLFIGDRTITVFNYNKNIHFTDEHITKAINTLKKISSSFPQILDKMKWLLVDDISQLSVLGDPERFPVNGTCAPQWNSFRMYPRGMSFIPHRIENVTNFEGTISHELAHLLENEFIDEWKEKFNWDLWDDHSDEWELRLTPDGQNKMPFNKKTGEMAPYGLVPNQPEQCVNYYAKISMGEDVAESIACYLLDPERLKKISPTKFEIISKHDKKLEQLSSSFQRIPKENIKVPKPEQETVSYFVMQPSS